MYKILSFQFNEDGLRFLLFSLKLNQSLIDAEMFATYHLRESQESAFAMVNQAYYNEFLESLEQGRLMPEFYLSQLEGALKEQAIQLLNAAYFDDFKCCLYKGSLSLAERYVEKLHGSYQLDAKQLLQDVYRREFYEWYSVQFEDSAERYAYKLQGLSREIAFIQLILLTDSFDKYTEYVGAIQSSRCVSIAEAVWQMKSSGGRESFA